MTLSAYALGTVARFKTLRQIEGNARDDLIEAILNEASLMVEGRWGRPLVSLGSTTEWHPGSVYPGKLGAELWVRQWPIVSVTSVHEAGVLLVSGTDYIIDKATGRLIRYADATSATPSLAAWPTTPRSVKVIYIGGYQNTAGTVVGALAVPDGVMKVFDDLVWWLYRHRTGGMDGLASESDATGTRSFMAGPPMITGEMYATLLLAGAVAPAHNNWTGEVAA